MSEKTKGEELREKLFYQPKNLSEVLSPEEKAEAENFSVPYKRFLDHAKTEREAVSTIVELLEKAGYTPFVPGTKYPAGAKVYLNNRGKALIASTIGTLDIGEGVRIEAAHIDSPRLDLKPNPLVEEQELCYFKTHYYGGIKKYQWTAIPLSLHGVVAKRDGTTVTVTIGEDPDDPVFCVTDLLPHLGSDQMKKTMSEGIKGEQLNILLGCELYPDEKVSERAKLNIMSLLAGKYGITEKDFQSAELCAVPAFPAKDLGLDRGMVGAYGHDDRVCAYAQLMAEITVKAPAHTTVTVFADKEETGSNGVTGLNSHFLVDFIADLAQAGGKELRHVLRASPAFPPTSTPPTTPPGRRLPKSTTAPTWGTVLFSPNTPAPGENPPPTTPRRSLWPLWGESWSGPTSPGRPASWARWTRGAAARWPCSSPSSMWTRWTSACRCFPCTPPSRLSPRPTFT